MKSFTFTTLCSLLMFSLNGQNTSAIIGKVFDLQGEAIAYANVLLFSMEDSTLVKGEVTADEGTFRLNALPGGNYRIEVQSLGFQTYETDALELKPGQNLNLPTITLMEAVENLETVEVKAERALIEVQPDKTVFNVEGSINAAGNTALELLRKSPGVIVDNNDNVLLNGKNGVQIYIDGKPSRLGTADLSALLNAMQSSEIEAIEIITNPSAKFEAEGNAGIINIRLRKDKRLGANANVSLGYSHGIWSKYNTSTSFNYRNRKMNVFGSYSFNDGEYQSWMNLYRIQGQVIYDDQSIFRSNGAYHSGKAGADFFLTKKSTLGFLVKGYVNDRNRNNTTITPAFDQVDNQIIYVLEAGTVNDGIRQNLNANINYTFDNGAGRILSLDADWGTFRSENDTYQPNFYKTPDEAHITDERIFTSQAPTDIDIYTFKFDYEQSALGGKLGAGAKISYVSTDNTYDFYQLLNSEEILDIDRSNNFVFSENINAAYLNYTRQVSKYTLNFGIRAEQTNSTGTLRALKPTNNDEVERHYLNLFPSAGISFQADPKNQLRLNYSRRIDRPNYQDLNPFEFKISELSYSRGNPFLRPQYTHSVSFAHTYNYRLTTSLTYSYTDDFFANISDSTEVSRTFLETINLDYQEVISLNISYPFSPKEWWNTYTSLTGYHTRNRADLGEGRIVDIKATVASIYHQSTFQLPKDFSFQLSGWFSSPSIWGAVYKTEANFSIDAGIQKRLWNNRANIKLSLTDVFRTAAWRGIQEFAGFYVDASGGWESKQIRLNFSYLLGNDQVKNARKRKTGLEEEASRVN